MSAEANLRTENHIDPIDQALEDGDLELFEKLLHERGQEVSERDRARIADKKAKRESQVLEEKDRIVSRGKALGIDSTTLVAHWGTSNPTPTTHNLTRERLRRFEEAVQPLFDAAHERLGKLRKAVTPTETGDASASVPDSAASSKNATTYDAPAAASATSSQSPVMNGEDARTQEQWKAAEEKEGVPAIEGEVLEWLENQPTDYLEFLDLLTPDEKTEQIKMDFEASRTCATPTDIASSATTAVAVIPPAETAGAASESTGQNSSEPAHECRNLMLVAETTDGHEIVRCNECGKETTLKKQSEIDEEAFAEEFRLMRLQMIAEGLIPENSEVVEQFRISDEDSARWLVRKIREHQNAVNDLMKQFQQLISSHLSFMNALNFRFGGQLREFVSDQLRGPGGEYKKKSLKYPEGTVFLRKTGGWVVKSEWKTKEWLEQQIDADRLLRENIDENFIEDYGIKLEVKFSKKKVKELAAAGSVIPGVELEPEHEDGKMLIGVGRSGWSFESAKRQFSKDVKVLSLRGDSAQEDDDD